MAYRMHCWSTHSSNEDWCTSGFSLVDVSNIQQAANKIGHALMAEKGAMTTPDLKIFIMPHLINENN